MTPVKREDAPATNGNGVNGLPPDAPGWFKLVWFSFRQGGLTFLMVVGVAAYSYCVMLPESNDRREAIKQQGTINLKMADSLDKMHTFMAETNTMHSQQSTKLSELVTSIQTQTVMHQSQLTAIEENGRKLDSVKKAVEAKGPGG